MNPLDLAQNLTARQVQVLYHAACGLDSMKTAKKLGISENTVKAHRSNIFTTLNVSNITAAVAVGIIAGRLDTNVIKLSYKVNS